jgi:Transposase DDE domain
MVNPWCSASDRRRVQEMKLPVVLEFYRARWQVELAFKRLKSLLQMGQVPKKKEASCRAWMQGKILTALLSERLLCEARFFPHGVTRFEEQSQWSVFKEFRDALLVQLAMPLNLTDLAKHRALLRENFTENRPNRLRQLRRARAASNP